MLSRRRFSVLSSVAPLAAPAIGTAQTPWPSRPIRWIVNFPPAGAADILSRTLAEWFGNRLGQPIVVENKPGAGGMLDSVRRLHIAEALSYRRPQPRQAMAA